MSGEYPQRVNDSRFRLATQANIECPLWVESGHSALVLVLPSIRSPQQGGTF